MKVVSLTERLNQSKNSDVLNLEDYYIDDVEVSALNFIFPYQDIKIKSIDELISKV